MKWRNTDIEIRFENVREKEKIYKERKLEIEYRKNERERY